MKPINEKIICQHCGQLIGFKHILNNIEYKTSTILSPNKYGTITQSKIRGTTSVEPYGNYKVDVGYELETQFKCLKCDKKTMVKTVNEY